MPEINDCGLGIRYWMNSSLAAFASKVNEYSGAHHLSDDALKSLQKIQDSQVHSFLDGNDSVSLKSAINRAEVFAANHKLSSNDQARIVHQAEENAFRLGIYVDEIVDELDNAFADCALVGGQGDNCVDNRQRQRNFIRVALEKLLASEEIRLRAVKGSPLSKEGFVALKNAVMGVVKMLADGKISENALLVFFNSRVFDFSNSADVLESCSRGAHVVRERFVCEDDVKIATRALKEQIDVLLRTPGWLETHREDAEHLVALYQRLVETGESMVNRRRAVAAGIVEDYSLLGRNKHIYGKGMTKTDQLKRLKESLRAFRYDLDCLTGKHMGLCEKVDRGYHNLFTMPSHKSRKRISQAEYSQLLLDDQEFGDALGVLKNILTTACNESGIALNEEFAAKVQVSDLATAIARSTDLSHSINDGIRLFLEGGEKAANEQYDAVHSQMSRILETGGTRKAQLEVGVDFMLGLDINLAKAGLKVGGKFMLDADITIPDGGGGPVTVTYKYGGAAYAGLQGQLGVDPKDPKNHVGVGAGIKANLEAGAKYTTSITYATLDDFIRHTNGQSLALSEGIGILDPFVSFVKNLHYKRTGNRWRENITQRHKKNEALVMKLQDSGALGKLDSLASKKRNVVILGRRTSVEVYGGLGGGANIGFYKDNGGKAYTNLSLKPEGSLGGSLDFKVKKTGLRHFSSMFKYYELADIKRYFDNQVELQQNGQDVDGGGEKPYINDIKAVLDAPVSKEKILAGVDTLGELYRDMRSHGLNHDSKDAVFWRAFAQRTRLFVTAFEILIREAGSLSQDEKAELGGVLKAAAALKEEVINPDIYIPEDIFESELYHSAEYGSPAHLTGKVSLEFGLDFDPLLSTVKSPSTGGMGEARKFYEEIGEKGQGETWKNFPADLGSKAAPDLVNDAMNVLAKPVDLKNKKIKAGLSYTKLVGKVKAPYPWENSSSCQGFFSFSADLPMRFLVESLTKFFFKQYTGETVCEESKIKAQVKEEVIYALESLGVTLGGTTALDFASMSIASVGAQCPKFAKMLGLDHPAKSNGLPERAGNRFSKDDLKTLTFRWDGGRLSSMAVSNDINIGYDFDVDTPLLPLGLHFVFKISSREIDHFILAKPRLNTMLNMVSALSSVNPQKLKFLLTHNKHAVLPLLKAAEENDNEIHLDARFREDRAEFTERFNEIEQIFKTLESRTNFRDKPAVARMKMEWLELLAQAKHPKANMSDLDKIDLTQTFLTAMANIYKFKVYADAQVA